MSEQEGVENGGRDDGPPACISCATVTKIAKGVIFVVVVSMKIRSALLITTKKMIIGST